MTTLSDPNVPASIGLTTTQTDISQTQATYLPPSESSIQYAKGIHERHPTPATPHASLTDSIRGGKSPHLIKKIESFYVRPRWLFVRVRLFSIIHHPSSILHPMTVLFHEIVEPDIGI